MHPIFLQYHVFLPRQVRHRNQKPGFCRHSQITQHTGYEADNYGDTGLTNPAAGVMATNPATAPEAAPRVAGFSWSIHSAMIHERAAAPVATCVLKKANAAVPSAARALPALNPNQPNHNRLSGSLRLPFPRQLQGKRNSRSS